MSLPPTVDWGSGTLEQMGGLLARSWQTHGQRLAHVAARKPTQTQTHTNIDHRPSQKAPSVFFMFRGNPGPCRAPTPPRLYFCPNLLLIHIIQTLSQEPFSHFTSALPKVAVGDVNTGSESSLMAPKLLNKYLIAFAKDRHGLLCSVSLK